MDIGALLKLKGLVSDFKRNHPRVMAFFGDAGRIVEEGSVVEISVTGKDGTKLTTNMRLRNSDIELLKLVGELSNK